MSGRSGKPARARLRIGEIAVDALTLGEALAAIDGLVQRGRGGAIFTPNVDHVVRADGDPVFRAAYARADLSLCDGQPLIWASRLLRHPLPEKVSGSDLFEPVMRLAARRGYRVYLLGGAPGVATEAAARLGRDLGVAVAGVAAPRIGLDALPDEGQIVEAVRAARPDLLLVCLGAPKGERFIDRVRDRLGPAVALQIGASLDFFVGRIRRAPRWMQRSGLEWVFRLLQEPRRLARRYLLQDPLFLIILLRSLRTPRAARVLPAPLPGAGEEPGLASRGHPRP